MAGSDPSEVTRLLAVIRDGDRDAASRLWPLVYDELRELARGRMAAEAAPRTLQPTALVNEAYLRLTDGRGPWESRAYFFAAAATAMRRILVEEARRRLRLRGGDRERTPLGATEVVVEDAPVDLLDLDAALERLEAIDEQKAAIVTMRYLLGCTVDETAEALGISPAKVKKDWTFARAWLRRQLEDRT